LGLSIKNKVPDSDNNEQKQYDGRDDNILARFDVIHLIWFHMIIVNPRLWRGKINY